jgi:endonuclease I
MHYHMKKTLFIGLLFLASLGFTQVPAYYNGINFSASSGSIYSQLATLVTNTHDQLTYSECWDALKDADLDLGSTTMVKLIYGYDDGDGNPVTDRTRDKNSNGGLNGEWNREHIFPKSLGSPDLGTDGPGADAHNLRASDVQQNGNRGNKKFTESSGNAGPTGGNWYPGDEWKGDCARIVMYMYLRYGTRCQPIDVGSGSINSSDENMSNMFLEWNNDDPVSQCEKNRNDALQDHQGNRNPFIDNPRIAYKIWGGPLAEDTWGGLSTEEQQNDLLIVYPNPIKDNLFFVSGLNTIDIDSFQLYSIDGKLIKSLDISQLVNNGAVSLDYIQSGAYVISITADNQIIQRKVIVE